MSEDKFNEAKLLINEEIIPELQKFKKLNEIDPLGSSLIDLIILSFEREKLITELILNVHSTIKSNIAVAEKNGSIPEETRVLIHDILNGMSTLISRDDRNEEKRILPMINALEVLKTHISKIQGVK